MERAVRTELNTKRDVHIQVNRPTRRNKGKYGCTIIKGKASL
ncbi:MAG: hypothetical protein ACLQDF_15390 [Desulfomonilia bacterium]